MYQPITFRSWVLATFLGWFIAIVFIVVLSGSFDAMGLDGYQFYIGLGIACGVGGLQGIVLRRRAPLFVPWLQASLVGLAVPFLLMDVISLYWFPLGEYYLPVTVAISSVVISVLQQRVLHRYFKNVRWTVRSVLGWWLACLAVLGVNYSMKYIHNNLAGFFVNLFLILVGGLILGLVTGGAVTRAERNA